MKQKGNQRKIQPNNKGLCACLLQRKNARLWEHKNSGAQKNARGRSSARAT